MQIRTRWGKASSGILMICPLLELNSSAETDAIYVIIKLKLHQ
jgi:hypothetical protein